MSRWLWALLGGVVLVAIAAFFWTASTRRMSHPRFCQAQRLSLPRRPAPPAPAPSAQETAPSPPLSPAPPAAQEAAAPPAPAPTAPPAPAIRRPMQDSKRPRRLLPRRPRDALGSARRRPGASVCSRSARRTASAAARARTGGVGSRGRICAQEPCAAGRDLGLFRGGLRAALPAARRRLGLSAAGGQVRSGRDCRVAEEDPSAFRHLPDRSRV